MSADIQKRRNGATDKYSNQILAFPTTYHRSMNTFRTGAVARSDRPRTSAGGPYFVTSGSEGGISQLVIAILVGVEWSVAYLLRERIDVPDSFSRWHLDPGKICVGTDPIGREVRRCRKSPPTSTKISRTGLKCSKWGVDQGCNAIKDRNFKTAMKR